MEYVIGIDSGATKSELIIADRNGNIKYTVIGGPANVTSLAEFVIKRNLEILINDALKKCNLKKEDCKLLCIGAAGVGRQNDELRLKKILNNIGFAKPKIITDAHAALIGGTGKLEGVLLIAGTGSICFGVNKQGEIFRTGGWGHILGDEGSAYDIGKKSLIEVLKYYDKRSDAKILTKNIMNYLKFTTADEIIEYVYKNKASKSEIAKLAKIVSESYLLGDLIARKILLESSLELFDLIKTTLKKMCIIKREVNIVLNGSVIEKNLIIKKNLMDKLKKYNSNIVLVNKKNNAAYGCIIMANNILGDINENHRY